MPKEDGQFVEKDSRSSYTPSRGVLPPLIRCPAKSEAPAWLIRRSCRGTRGRRGRHWTPLRPRTRLSSLILDGLRRRQTRQLPRSLTAVDLFRKRWGCSACELGSIDR